MNDNPFQNCTNLLYCIFPCTKNKVIGRYVFGGCTKLKEVIFMEGITQINGEAFYNCTSMEYIEIPSTLTTFYLFSGSTYNTFYNVPKGCSVICKAITPPSAVNNVFNRFYGNFYVPDESVEAYKAATGWSSIAARIFPLSEYDG